MALPELAGWKTESLRVTFFANEPVTGAGRNWWQAATGSAPETVVSKPSASEHSESGPFGSGLLEMKVAFNRVDWIYTPVISPEPAIPSLGDAAEVLDSLNAPLTSWLAFDETPYVRLAFGPTMHHQVSDIADGNRAVLAYLPFLQIEPVTARDVFSQINFPCNSATVDGLLINRLNKFMCSTAQVINMNRGQAIPMIQTLYYCRCELDFNTDAELAVPIPVDRRVDVMHELAAACREMMSAGVRP